MENVGNDTTTGAGATSNADLSKAFADAINSAKQTLIISTKGQAELNALRARPN